MKYIFIFLISFFIGILGIILFSSFRQNGQLILTPIAPNKPQEFSILSPPANSLRGTITAMNDVLLQSRIATQGAKFNQPQPVQQGEEYFTGEKGSLSIQFPKTLFITMDKNTHLNFVQTLPVNIVVNQDKGTAIYEKIGTVPISVRTKRLLISIDGKANLSFDDLLVSSTLTIKKGAATVAYNDINYVSTIQKLTEGQKFVFNYITKQGTIE